jgi:hypothetical protein
MLSTHSFNIAVLFYRTSYLNEEPSPSVSAPGESIIHSFVGRARWSFKGSLTLLMGKPYFIYLRCWRYGIRDVV